MGRLIVGIGLFAIISIGAFVFRDYLSQNAGELQVGDCFDVPAGDEIGDVQHHPCTDAHDGEVILVADFNGSATYPTIAAFDSWVKTRCADKAFRDYVGESFAARQDIDLGYFYPKEESWKSGKDRSMICYVTPVAGGKVNVSFARAAPAQN